MMDIIFDSATSELRIETSGVRPWGADVRAVVDRHGHVIDLSGVQMGLTVTADGQEIADITLPAPEVSFVRTSQDVLATARVLWAPDQEIAVSAWCKLNVGAGSHVLTAETTFAAPRWPQPFPSWEWSGGSWQPPVPYPDGGLDWQWDEEAQEWQEVT